MRFLGADPTSATTRDAMLAHFDVQGAEGEVPDGTPFLVSGHAAKQSAVESGDQLREHLRQGGKLVLLDATASHANDLMEALGLTGSRHGDPELADWRAVQLASNGQALWTRKFRRIQGHAQDDAQLLAAVEDRAMRRSMEHLGDWLQTGGPTRPVEPIRGERARAAFRTASDESSDLDEIVDLTTATWGEVIWDAYYDTDNDDQDACAESTSCDDTAENYPYARYTIQTYAYSAYSYCQDKDFWLFEVVGNLAQSNAYVYDGSTERGWYATDYRFANTFMYAGTDATDSCAADGVWSFDDDYDLQFCESGCDEAISSTDGLSLVESSPATEEDCTVTTYTASTSTTISGNVGTVDSISNGLSFSDSASYSSVDVCTVNDSGADQYDAVDITSEITAPSVSSSGLCTYHSIDSPSASATSTYQPSSLWVWSTSSLVRDAQSDSTTDGDSLLHCGALWAKWEKKKLTSSEWYDTCSHGGVETANAYFLLPYYLLVDFVSIDDSTECD